MDNQENIQNKKIKIPIKLSIFLSKLLEILLTIWKFIKKHKILFFIIIPLLIVIYFSGVWYYSFHYLPRTYVNNIYVGSQMPDVVEKWIDYSNSNGKFEVLFNDDKKEFINLDKLDLKTTRTTEMVDLMKKQNEYMWIFHLLYSNKNHVNGVVSINTVKLKNMVEKLKHCDETSMIESKDAYVYFENGTFKVFKEIEGNKFNIDDLYKAILNKIQNCENFLDLKEAKIYQEPKITENDDEIKNLLKACRKYCSANIKYSGTDLELNGKEMMNWLKYNDSDKTYEKDENAFENGINQFLKEVESKFNTKGSSRTVTIDGTSVQVSGGNWGNIIDSKSELEFLKKAINDNLVTTRTPSTSGNDVDINGGIGDSYIAVKSGKVISIKNSQTIFKGWNVQGNLSKGVWIIDDITFGSYEKIIMPEIPEQPSENNPTDNNEEISGEENTDNEETEINENIVQARTPIVKIIYTATINFDGNKAITVESNSDNLSSLFADKTIPLVIY